MAFPIPTHLPRRSDSSSSLSVINKLESATHKTLTATLAGSWTRELENDITTTKKQIRERVHKDLPLFEQQEASSRTVQTRLRALEAEVESQSHKLSDPETGLTPVLIRTLAEHATLRQQACEATILHDTLGQLQSFNTDLEALDTLIKAGHLSQAAAAFQALDSMLEQQPVFLTRSAVMGDLKARFRASKARVEDQLSDAYRRSLSITPDTLLVHSSIQVRQSTSTIAFKDILSALSPSALADHLNILRRDLVAAYIIRILEHGAELHATEDSLLCKQTAKRDISQCIDNVSTVLKFLSARLFPCLPEPQNTQFPRSLRKPIAQGILNNLLKSSLPSTPDELPSYLETLRAAVGFETNVVLGTLACGEPTEAVIAQWAAGVATHYEKQRRQSVLDSARVLATTEYPKELVFTVEIEAEVLPAVVPVQGDEDVAVVEEPVADDAWGFEEDVDAKSNGHTNGHTKGEVEEDAWGFDDEEPEPEKTNGHSHEEENGGDGWGWEGEDEDANGTEDDPWDDDPWGESPAKKTISPAKPAKAANGLMKKDKKKATGDSTTPNTPSPRPEQRPPEKEKKPPKLEPPPPPPPKETYIVSMQMKEVLQMVLDVVEEGAQLSKSHIFESQLLSNTAPSILDMFRAMYPVVFSEHLKSSLSMPILFSNNCIWLADEVQKIPSQQERMREIARRLKVLGESWLGDAIDQQRRSVDATISDGAAGFEETGVQDCYDECEAALGKVVRDIKAVAAVWRGLLPKGRFYEAIGAIVEAAIGRVVEDVTALEDIPAVESRQLSELCRIFLSLESLFVEDDSAPFVAAYVPSWFKFSYLSELLEASMADIRFLFDEGMLVDFESDELVRLVYALFADTALRAETISKIENGHSLQVPSSEVY